MQTWVYQTDYLPKWKTKAVPRVFQIVLRGKSPQWKFCQGNCFIEWWEPEAECFWPFKHFSKLKTTFCKYWTLIKVKISMACVYKEHEVKMKLVQEQWQHLKMKFLLVNIVIWWGKLNFGRGNKNLVGRESTGGDFSR